MMPKVEAGILRLTIVTAREFAEEGRLGAAYRCLAQALGQARTAACRGEPWGARLVLDYLDAERDFIRRYGVQMG